MNIIATPFSLTPTFATNKLPRMLRLKLFMVLTGCRPKGRNTEQHDIFFGIAPDMAALVPALKASWPNVPGEIHIDAWREVTLVNGYRVDILPNSAQEVTTEVKLFFINLGGYQRGWFEELHYKMVVAAPDISKAIQAAKTSEFYQQNTFKGAVSHIDDKFGIDIDEVLLVDDLIPETARNQYSIALTPFEGKAEDINHIGYFKLSSFL